MLLRNGEEVTVPIEQVQKGDIFVVRPGENIPVDGVVLEGSQRRERGALTGESIPVDKAGRQVSAATINQSGFLNCRSHPRGRGHHAVPDHPDGQRCRRHQGTHCQNRRQRFRLFVPAVITIAVITTIVWLLQGRVRLCAGPRHFVLVISCPCALGLARRLPLWWATAWAPKTASCSKPPLAGSQQAVNQIVALDKTGTITSGEPQVTDILPAEGVTESELLRWPLHWSRRASTRWPGHSA